mgnify:CR=1 FL=1
MFYGWWVVASVFAAQFFMVGFYTYTYPLIVVPVKESFGATTTQMNMAMTISTVAGVLLPPLVGPLVDRWSARKIMILGAVMFSSALGLLSLGGAAEHGGQAHGAAVLAGGCPLLVFVVTNGCGRSAPWRGSGCFFRLGRGLVSFAANAPRSERACQLAACKILASVGCQIGATPTVLAPQ